MPTYTVTTANVSLSRDQKGRIAEAITGAHHKSTGAPGFFAQVVFRTLQDGEHFIGGKPNVTPHVFVHGMIRAGRSSDVKRALMSEAAAEVQAIAGVGAEDVWFYVQDIEAQQMIEFGRFLPEPGAENEWRKGITPEKLAAFKNAGVAL